jgi:hypothetical protein
LGAEEPEMYLCKKPRRAFMKKPINILQVSVLLIALIFPACNAEKISQNQQRLERYAVQIKDLPDGWGYSGQNWFTEYGGEGYLRGYGVKGNDVIRFVHTISLFSDSAQAVEAYSKWENDEFDTMTPWAEANFVPSDSRDDFRFECEQVLSGITSCSYLQRHNQFIVNVYVNINDEVMTFSQLDEVLKILDERLNTVGMEK